MVIMARAGAVGMLIGENTLETGDVADLELESVNKISVILQVIIAVTGSCEGCPAEGEHLGKGSTGSQQ